MPKLAGDHVRVLVDGYELTGDSNRIGIDESRDTFDVTAFGDEARNFIAGRRSLAARHAGFMNSAAGAAHPLLKGLAVDGLFSLYLGENAAPEAGDLVFSLLARQSRYSALPTVNQAIPFEAQFANRGEFGGWGVALACLASFVGSSSGEAIDGGAASDRGGAACLHLLGAAADDRYAFRVDGSASGAFQGEESVVARFSLDGSATGSELVRIDATIPRYARWAASSPSATNRVAIAISLIRN